MLNKNVTKCPNDKEPLLWHQAYGMRLVREIIPEKPKRPYFVYDAKCSSCGEEFEVYKGCSHAY